MRQTLAQLRTRYLRCEYRENPLGIDVKRPRLSWIVESKRRGERQTAYRVLVARSRESLDADRGDLWDTGKVASDETLHVEYRGKPLRSGMACFWKVRVWDRDGRASAWSRPATWSMGLLKDSDWKARWIGLDLPELPEPRDLDGCQWIWFPEGDPRRSAPLGTCCFRRVIELPANRAIRRASIVLAVDSYYRVSVNGGQIVNSGQPARAQEADITWHLRPGKNTVTVIADNLGMQPKPAGFIGRILLEFERGRSVAIPTDRNWRVSRESGTGGGAGVPPVLFHGQDARTAARHGRDAHATSRHGRDAHATSRHERDAHATWPRAMELGKYGRQPFGRPEILKIDLRPPRLLRKTFRVAKPIRRATVHASALGVYELRLNGRKVGEDVFTPGWTDYRTRVYYNTYDVTDTLHAGVNTLGALLGDGWFTGYVGPGLKRERFGTNEPRFLAQLHLEYADGTGETLATDRTWKAATGATLEADMQMGETYDARLDAPGWDGGATRKRFDDSRWRGVSVGASVRPRLQSYPGSPVRVFREIRPLKIMRTIPGRHTIDMGTNFAGCVRLKVKARRGHKIVVRFGERLNPDGTVYTNNLRRARAVDTYICRGSGEEVWQPRFTFHGFQYVELIGYPGTPDLDSVTGIEYTASTPVAGEFKCSDRTANTLYRNICQTQRSNFIEVPTDCPQRDERLGWTGDAQIYIRTATYNTDVAAFFGKWLTDLEDAQSPDGAFPDVAPTRSIRGGGKAAWADAGVICPMTFYQVYGDKRQLARRYESMTRWIEFCRANSWNLIRGPHGYGDWLSIHADTPINLIATAYFAHSTRLVAEAARILGKKTDARKYDALFREIREAFNRVFVDKKGVLAGDTQSAYVMAIAFDLLSPKMREAAALRLVANLRARGWRLSTGFLGTKDLMGVLTKIGRPDVAYRLFHNDTFPSWGFSIRHGATSIWERWDGWTPEKGFQTVDMNSFAHYSFGAVAEWMFRTVGGIDTDGPAYKRIAIRPLPGGRLTWARVAYESIRGRIAVDWKTEGGRLEMNVRIPANTTATIHVPAARAADVTESGKPAARTEGLRFLRMEDGAAVFEAGSGSYAFVSKSPQIISSS
ncbi:family 78 glycoside hydrolase catalytic domain [Candidatus Sumerlaeota bacterium]|nr:family 78 glycoside hydrolase catalytic domain [Candidatus Sumerlaeota bacterium]